MLLGGCSEPQVRANGTSGLINKKSHADVVPIHSVNQLIKNPIQLRTALAKANDVNHPACILLAPVASGSPCTMLSSVGPLSSVVAFVPARVDADVSVHSAVVLKLQAAGARVSKQLGATTTHVVLLQKLLPSFAEQVLQDDLIKDLYERIEKVGDWSNASVKSTHSLHSRNTPCTSPTQMNSRARIVSNLWVHASTESGTKADVSVCVCVHMAASVVLKAVHVVRF